MRLLLIAAATALVGAQPLTAQRPVQVAPNAPKDKPLTPTQQCQWDATMKAIQPYVKQARASWPGARARFANGLPARETMFATTVLRDARGVPEQVFVAIDSINGARIVGRIWSDIAVVQGFRHGQTYAFSDTALVDWMISKPDGSEEGNLVGKFIDAYKPPATC